MTSFANTSGGDRTRDAARTLPALARSAMSCALGMALLPFGVGCSAPAGAVEPGFVVVASRTAPNNLDPRLANDETSTRVSELVFDSLLDLGDDLRIKPVLASSFENPDPLTYVAR